MIPKVYLYDLAKMLFLVSSSRLLLYYAYDDDDENSFQNYEVSLIYMGLEI